MKFYVVVIEDRHIDVGVYLFSDKETAISEAKRIAQEYAANSDEYEEVNYEDWEFFAMYSCEGDSVRVEEVELDKKIENYTL